MTSAQFWVTLRGSALVFLAPNVYALIHFLTLFRGDSARLTWGTVYLTFLTLTRAFDSRVGESSYLWNLGGAVRHLVVSWFGSSLFLTSYHLFFHMLNTLLGNYLSSSWATLSSMRSAYALRLLRCLLQMIGSLFQYSIGGTPTGIVHRIIHLISNWGYILVLYRLIASVSTLSRFWFVTTTSHLASRLTLPRCRGDSVCATVSWTYVLSAAQIVAGSSVGINGMIARL